MAGRRNQGGQVIGASDEIGRAPRGSFKHTRPDCSYRFRRLGIDLGTELPGAGGRPIPLVDRGTEPISELLALKLSVFIRVHPVANQSSALAP